MRLRKAHASDVEPLAQLWHRGWQDAHAAILPEELARHRTLENFRNRLALALTTVRVAVGDAGHAGFCMVRGDELYQLFVAAGARGSGVALALLEDGERRIRCGGAARAWLACAIGNGRAARFYEKHGWTRAGTMTSELPTPDGIFRLEVWRYEKDLEAIWPLAPGPGPLRPRASS